MVNSENQTEETTFNNQNRISLSKIRLRLVLLRSKKVQTNHELLVYEGLHCTCSMTDGRRHVSVF